jgi:hypothetical protein
MHKDTVLFPPRHVFMDKNVGKNDKRYRHGDGGMDNKPGACIPTTAHSSLIIRARTRERKTPVVAHPYSSFTSSHAQTPEATTSPQPS